jgi:hypothetical protein
LTELALAKLLHVDFLRFQYGRGTLGTNFEIYLRYAKSNLFHEKLRPQQVPAEHFGELFLLRPPANTAWL